MLGIPPFYVLPREEVQRLGAQFNLHPVGTGPYKLRTYDKSNNRYTADRFPGYEYANRLPYLDSLDWQWSVGEDLYVIPDDCSCVLLFSHEGRLEAQFPSEARADAFSDAVAPAANRVEPPPARRE